MKSEQRLRRLFSFTNHCRRALRIPKSDDFLPAAGKPIAVSPYSCRASYTFHAFEKRARKCRVVLSPPPRNRKTHNDALCAGPTLCSFLFLFDRRGKLSNVYIYIYIYIYIYTQRRRGRGIKGEQAFFALRFRGRKRDFLFRPPHARSRECFPRFWLRPRGKTFGEKRNTFRLLGGTFS